MLKHRVLHLITLASVVLTWAATAANASRALPSDPSIVSGKLDNGVTWMYRQHDNPPGKMAAIVHIRTGSLNETEEQRGLAHFMEHMAFNGTENFPPGELIPYFESIGMQFGADVNAFTSFDQTSYMLFLPDTTDAQINKAMMVLSDYAFRALLLEKEIDKERGVILEESRTGKDARQRMRDELWPELFEGSRFAERLPIGKDEVIANAPRSEFVDYYRTWYRPENVTVILVGDTGHEQVLPHIKEWFGSYKADRPLREQKGPQFKPFSKTRAMIVTDPEFERGDVQVNNMLPGRGPTTTVEGWREELVESLAGWLLTRRYEERVKKGEATYRTANAGVGDFFQEAQFASANAIGEPAKWDKMLEELIIELNRAREFGFTERELDLARKEFQARAERGVETEATQNARSFMFRILFGVNEKEPILSAQQELDLHKELLDGVNLDEVNRIIRENFTPETLAYVVQLPEKEEIQVPSRETVLAAAKSAWARKVQPLDEGDAPTELLASAPTPGKVVESTRDDALGVISAWLENGIRVHHRFMDYKKDSVWVTISLAGGLIEENAGNNGVTDAALVAINEPATSRLTSSNVRDIMTGSKISVSADSEGDSVVIQVSGSPADLEKGLQLAHALLTDGRVEEAVFDKWKSQTLEMMDRRERMPFFKAIEGLMDIVMGNDPRKQFPSKESIEARTVEEAQAWFDRLARTAPVEVAVVGDLGQESVMPLIEKYIGSLAKRERSADHLRPLRILNRPTGPWKHHSDVDIAAPQAVALTGFLSCDGRDVQDRRALDLAAQVLSSRVIKRIREDLSLVYSIRASNQPAWVFRDSGRFMAGSQCDPANVDRLIAEVRTIFQDFADNGPTEDELANAKKQIANDLDTGMREPGYWLSILKHLDLRGRSLEDEKREKEAYEEFTADRVRAVFAKYDTPERRFNAVAVPANAEKEVTEQPVEAGAN